MGARRSNAGARASTTWSATATWSTATRVHDAVHGAVDLADSSAHRLLSLSDHATDLLLDSGIPATAIRVERFGPTGAT